jgi:hypothetical protein
MTKEEEQAGEAIAVFMLFNEAYRRIESIKWFSVEQREHLLNEMAILIAQYEGMARWTIGEVLKDE